MSVLKVKNAVLPAWCACNLHEIYICLIGVQKVCHLICMVLPLTSNFSMQVRDLEYLLRRGKVSGPPRFELLVFCRTS